MTVGELSGGLRFTPDGKALAAEGEFWEVGTWKQLAGKYPKALAEADAVSPDGKVLATSAAEQVNEEFRFPVVLRDSTAGTERRRLAGYSVMVSAADFSPDGRVLATASNGGAVRLWDVATGRLRAELRGNTQGATAVAFSPNGRTLVTAGDDRVKLWDPEIGQERLSLRHEGRQPRSLAFSPDGLTLAVAWESRPGPLAGSPAVTLYRAAP
jgi:WD40 repeat protein